MKRIFFLISIISVISLFSSCIKDPIPPDLTVGIAGVYSGAFSSEDNGSINPYILTVSKISKTKIKVSTENEIEFDNTEFELISLNDKNQTLFSTTEGNRHLIEFVQFVVSDSITTMRLEFLPLSKNIKFFGIKK